MIGDFDEHDAAMRWWRLGQDVEAKIREDEALFSPDAITARWNEALRIEGERRRLRRVWRRAGCPLTFELWLEWLGHDAL